MTKCMTCGCEITDGNYCDLHDGSGTNIGEMNRVDSDGSVGDVVGDIDRKNDDDADLSSEADQRAADQHSHEG